MKRAFAVMFRILLWGAERILPFNQQAMRKDTARVNAEHYRNKKPRQYH